MILCGSFSLNVILCFILFVVFHINSGEIEKKLRGASDVRVRYDADRPAPSESFVLRACSPRARRDTSVALYLTLQSRRVALRVQRADFLLDEPGRFLCHADVPRHLAGGDALLVRRHQVQIGRASCRERV